MAYGKKTTTKANKVKTCPGCKTPQTCKGQNRCRMTGQRLS